MPVIEHNGKRVWYPAGVDPETVRTALEYHVEDDEIEYLAGKLVQERMPVEEEEIEEPEPEEPKEQPQESLKEAITPLIERIAGADALRDALRDEMRSEMDWHKGLVKALSERPAEARKVCGLVVVRDKKGLIQRVDLEYDA